MCLFIYHYQQIILNLRQFGKSRQIRLAELKESIGRRNLSVRIMAYTFFLTNILFNYCKKVSYRTNTQWVEIETSNIKPEMSPELLEY